jgi:hypothetical protein
MRSLIRRVALPPSTRTCSAPFTASTPGGQLKDRLQLSDTERQMLAEIGAKLGKQALEEVANIFQPDTILGWHRKLVANKFDGSEQRKSLGRPRVDKELEDWVVKMAKENRGWGYDRIAGALAELGYDISD